MAEDLYDLGYRAAEELNGDDPGQMYRRLCHLRGSRIGRCILYVFCCSIYFASNNVQLQKLLKW